MRSVLAVDVGGTKVALALVKAGADADDPSRIISQAQDWTAAYNSLDAVLTNFMANADGPKPASACIAVAGPVRDGRSTLPNIGWTVSASALQMILGCPTLVVNDLVATVHGVDAVPADARVSLQAGAADPTGARAVIAPGTGLGMASAARQSDGGWLVMPSEGGHQDFAARTPLEWELRQSLAGPAAGHVDIESVASGLGLHRIYAFLTAQGLDEADPTAAARIRTARDPNPLIAAAARAGCVRSRQAMAIFVGTLGAAAGDLALSTLATGGLYVAGGIPAKISDFLEDGTFIDAFVAKGRFRTLLEAIPVYMITEPATALLGAAALAQQSLSR
ncbi:MAG: glucokinase [Myxococcota bacterium]|jgi:glucokinase